MKRRSRIFLVPAGLALLLLLAVWLAQRHLFWSLSDDDLLLEDVRVFDPVAGAFTEPLDILIRGNRIAATGRLWNPLAAATRVAAGGRFAVPGLWDCHVHLSFLTLGGDSLVRAVLEGFVRHGVTNVRDVGGVLDTVAALSARAARGEILGPRIRYAGPLLSRPPLGDLEQYNAALPGMAVAVESPADIDGILDRLVRQGASMTKAIDRWDPALFRYYVDGAAKRALPVVWDPGLPILNPIPIDTALAVGVASVEHARAAWPAVLRDDLKREVEAFMAPGARVDYAAGAELLYRTMALGERSVVPERLTAIADTWARSGAYFCPTLTAAEANLTGDGSAEDRRPVEGLLAVSRMFVRELASRGVRLLVGQDGAGAPDGTWYEMEALGRAGVRAVEILRAATLNAAEWHGAADRFGTLERGKTADVLILDADPLERIENIRSVWRVVYDGRLVPTDGTFQ